VWCEVVVSLTRVFLTRKFLMTYEFRAHTVMNPDEPIKEAHERIFRPLTQLEGLWCFKDVPKTPRMKRAYDMATGEFAEWSSIKIKEDDVTYRYRTRSTHFRMDVDSLSFQFHPTTENYASLLEEFIPALIKSMVPHYLIVGDVRFDETTPEPDGSIILGKARACGGLLHPVSLLDDVYLERNFGVTLEQALKAVEPVAEKVVPMEGCIYVVGSSEMLEFDAAVALAHKLEAAIRGARPKLMKRTLNRLTGKV